MTFRLIGKKELHARLDAIKPNVKLMGAFALAAVAEQKILVPRRTGNLGRSIRIGAVTPSYAETIATADYAAYVELGTKGGTIIVPRNRKALRWAAQGSATLSGRVRKGGRAIFAKRVKRGATRAQPYMMPGAIRALEKVGAGPIEQAWDDAG